jgi:hypothetical protein
MPLIRIPGLINALVVENVRQLRELERHEHVSPTLSSGGSLLHRVLASRLARDLGFRDGELPAIASLDITPLCALDPDGLIVTGGELYCMGSYVAGSYRGEAIEVVVQRWLARRFNPRYEASPSVRDAARLLGGWHRRPRLSAFAYLARRRLEAARALVSSSVAAEVQAAYAPALLLPYIMRCLETMRRLARNPLMSERLSPELVVSGCVAAPHLVFRCCTREVQVSFLARPLPAHTLLILPARRLRAAGAGSSAVGSDDTSRYPALRLIRRLLMQVWMASRDVHYPRARAIVPIEGAATERLPPVHRLPSTTSTTLEVASATIAPDNRGDTRTPRSERRRSAGRLTQRGVPLSSLAR